MTAPRNRQSPSLRPLPTSVACPVHGVAAGYHCPTPTPCPERVEASRASIGSRGTGKGRPMWNAAKGRRKEWRP